jgi:photosystem II stability/assembly factor-like uncharacterized protein
MATLLPLFITQKSFAQEGSIPMELQKRIAGKTKLEDIMNTVAGYYRQTNPSLLQADAGTTAYEFEKNPYHQWVKWATYMSARTLEDGTLTNAYERTYREAMKVPNSPMDISQQATTSIGTWSFIGPWTTSDINPIKYYLGLGRVDRLVAAPSNPNILYAGTPAGGLWRSSNAGNSWTNPTRYLPSPGISGICVSRTDHNTLYILTGEGDTFFGGFVNQFGYTRNSVGVLKSTDGGTTWSETAPFPNATSPYAGFEMAMDPNNDNVILAATTAGLYRTTDGGGSWTRVRAGIFFDVKFAPGSSTIVYASGQGADRFVLSSNGGANWTNAITWNPGTPGGHNRGKIAVAPSNAAVVYLLLGPVTDTGVYRGLYRSSNNGASFTLQSTTPNILGRSENGQDVSDQSGYDLAMAVDADISSTIYTGGLNVWKSTNSGVTMTSSTSYNENGAKPYAHPDIHDIIYVVNGATKYLYAAGDGGIWRSSDDGTTWTDLANNSLSGIATTQFYHGTGFAGDNNLFLGGAQDNGMKYRGLATSDFEHIVCCDGFDAAFWPNNSTKAYGSINQGVSRFDALPGSEVGITPFVNGQWFARVATHPTDGAIVYVGVDSFWKHTGGGTNVPGKSWTFRNVPAAWVVQSCPSNVDRIYIAGGTAPWANTGTLRRSDDQGNSFTIKSNTAGFPGTFPRITDIGVRPNNSLTVWVTFGGFSAANKVLRSADGGDSWTNVTGSLPNVPVFSIVIDSYNNAYVGTDIGVYYRGAGMSDWVPFYNFLPRVPVTDLILNETAQRIKAVTFGRGVWESDIYGACTPTLATPGSITGYKYYEASQSVTSAATVFGGANTEVFLKAGDYVQLNPGFIAEQGNNVVRVQIGPCGSGLPQLSAEPTNQYRDSLLVGIRALNKVTARNNLYPLGAIRSISEASGQYQVELTLPKEATVYLEIQDGSGKFPGYKTENITLGSGTHKVPISQDIGSLSSSNHWYIVLRNGEYVADFKEL